MNPDEEDISYFNAAGEYLEDLFKLSDFLKEHTTREILEENHNTLFETHVEPKIKKIYETKKQETIENTRLLHRDNRGLFLSELLELIYKHIDKKYDLEIFYDNPELAKCLVAKYKNNIKN